MSYSGSSGAMYESSSQGAACRAGAAETSASCGLRRRWPLVLVALFAAFAVIAQLGRRVVVANTTQSVEPGLYLAVPGAEVGVGRLMSFRVPEAARPYFAGRAGRPVGDADGWFLIKPVAAGPGDAVDTTGRRVLINGRDLGPIFTHDGAGRKLPRWRERRTLRDGEWFVLSRRGAGSLDGRYFGPIRRQEVEHVRRPLVRWGEDGGPWRWLGTCRDGP